LVAVPARLRIALFVAALGAFAVLAVVILSARGDNVDAAGPWAGAIRPAGAPVADFTLRDQDGDLVRMTDLRGKPVVLTFLYSTCRDTCPIMAQTVRGALDQVGQDVPAVAVSVDPGSDTTSSAREFLVKQKVTGRMEFLLGSRAQLEPVWAAYGISPQRRSLDHSAWVVLLDKQGRQRIGFPADQATADDIAHDLRRLSAEPA
jgi:protein SCO1/2